MREELGAVPYPILVTTSIGSVNTQKMHGKRGVTHRSSTMGGGVLPNVGGRNLCGAKRNRQDFPGNVGSLWRSTVYKHMGKCGLSL